MSSFSTAMPPRRNAPAATVRAVIGEAQVPYRADFDPVAWGGVALARSRVKEEVVARPPVS